MNERIRELEAQCWEPRKHPASQAALGDKFNTEKFAQLIVKECMDIISDESEKVSDEWRCKDGKHIWWKIKEHFGVE